MSTTPARRQNRIPRPWVTFLRAVLVAAGSVVLGVLVLVAVAFVSSRPEVLFGSGLVAAAAVVTAGCRWVARGHTGRRRRLLVWGTVGVAALSVTGTGLLLALPADDPSRPAAAVEGQRFWSLPTGSQLRYVDIPARGDPRPSPVVFVHGGPGTPDLARDVEYFGKLADEGFDVYVYDQVGAGRSVRLDPQQYSRDRDVADLEAIRQAIGADRMVLIGHSYGASVVAGYLAAHPERVDRIVLASPESLDPADESGGNLQSRLDGDQRRELYGLLLRPRNLLVYSLLQVNPHAAYAMAGDAEMDAANDLVYAATEPALHCPGHAVEPPPTGLGFYRLQYPQSATAPAERDLRPRLSGEETPALLVKGSCDYLSWASVVTYLETLSEDRLVYLQGGHNIHQDAPGKFLAVVRAFLTDRPLPVAPYDGATAPPDYEGQH